MEVIFILIEQCDWYCDYNEADESYKCLHEADFCDGAPVCTVGTDEDYCDAVRFVFLVLVNQISYVSISVFQFSEDLTFITALK